VGLIGENWYRGRRNIPGRKAKERARSSSRRRPGFRLEILETRVLLFGGQLPQSAHLITLNAETAPSAVLQMLPWTSVPQGNPALPGSGPKAGNPASPRTLQIGLSALAQQQADPLIVEAPTPADVSSPGFPIGGGALVVPAAPIDAPLVVTMGSESPPSAGGLYESTTAGPLTGSFDTTETAIGAHGIASLSITSGPSLTWSTVAATRNGPLVSLGRFAEVEGSLSPGQSTADVTFPITPGTAGYRFLLKADGNPGPSEQPVVDDVAMEDQSGTTVAQVNPTSGPGVSPAQNLYLALHDVPAEAHLVVQVTTAGAVETAAGTSTVIGPAASSNVSFVLYVQRQQTPEPAAESAVPAQSQTALGTVAFESSSLGAGAVTAADTAVGATGDGAPAGQGAAVASSADIGASIEPDISDGFNFRVLTGPLASRSSGPIGPILADADVDPTPPVDRHERALIQDIQGLEQADGPRSTLARDELAGVTPSSNVLDASVVPTDDLENSDGLTASRGRGLTFEDTAHRSGRRAGLNGLLAALPASGGSETVVTGDAETAGTAARSQPVQASEAISSPDREQRTDYVKAAFGLVLGLGLTAGPLFPDLLTSGRVRVPIWLRKLRNRPGTGGLSTSRRRRLHAIGNWLGGRLTRRRDAQQ